jgi:N-acetylglucosaminyldiphosphoundecaprenol N-acetyl-beta-D-mannosaminyltransferase
MSTPLERLPIRHFLGVSIHAVTLDQAAQICRDAIVSRNRIMVGVVNVGKLVQMRKDVWLRNSVLGSDLIVADGLPVVWASRILDEPLPERVTGIDLFEKLLDLADQERFSGYFLGAKQEVLDEMLQRIKQRYPNFRCAGSRNGYFEEADSEAIVREIQKAEPDILFVGISTPKKELFLQRCQGSLSVPICHGVGGSFDVMAGLTTRAPVVMQELGLEWFYRIIQEPHRMWKRYLVTNSAFIAMLAREWLRKKLG